MEVRLHCLVGEDNTEVLWENFGYDNHLPLAFGFEEAPLCKLPQP